MCHQNAFLPQIAKIRQKALDTPYKREKNKSNVVGIRILYENKMELVLACRPAVKRQITLKIAFEKAY